MKIAVAGSTPRTLSCLQTLWQADDYEVAWVLTPAAKKIGRDQVLTENPVAEFATNHAIPTVKIETKIDDQVKAAVMAANQADHIEVLLVVDFGYLVPQWLLDLPQLAPLNIHPSLLPRWRGSSPGQFCLLYGDQESAVSLMTMNASLDEGDIIAQIPFEVGSDWTQTVYYKHSFELINQELAALIRDFASGAIASQPQPSESPTPIARRLSKQDSQVSSSILAATIRGETPKITESDSTSQLLLEANQHHQNWPLTLEHAVRAFSPWPGLWSLVETPKGPQRLKVLTAHLDHHKLILDQVQLEGKTPSSWEQTQTQLTLL